MSYSLILMLSIFAAMGVANMTSTNVRNAAAELDPEARERIFSAEAAGEFIWKCLEWLGPLIIILSLYSNVLGRGNSLMKAAGGAVLMCVVALASAWRTSRIYAREAPGTKAAAAARNAALMVSAIELIVIGVVVGVLYARGGLNKFLPSKSSSATSDEAEVSGDADAGGIWLDETLTLKELPWLKADDLALLRQGTNLRTKKVAGKTLYNATDIERLKQQNRRDGSIPNE